MSLMWITNPMWLVINSLVAFRVTRLLVIDSLPPIPWIRAGIQQWAADRWTEQHHPHEATADRWAELEMHDRTYGGEHPIATLVTCPWCLGFWVSLAVAVAASLIPAPVWVFVAAPFALSAIVGLLHRAAE